jgi:hypothetical protein
MLALGFRPPAIPLAGRASALSSGARTLRSRRGLKLNALVRIGKSALVSVRCRHVVLAMCWLTAYRQVAIQRLVPARIRVDQNGPVLLDHQQSGRLRQEPVQATGVGDFAAGNDQAQRGNLPSVPDMSRKSASDVEVQLHQPLFGARPCGSVSCRPGRSAAPARSADRRRRAR